MCVCMCACVYTYAMNNNDNVSFIYFNIKYHLFTNIFSRKKFYINYSIIYVYFIIGIPVWVGKELYTRYEKDNKHKRNAFIVGGVTASVS